MMQAVGKFQKMVGCRGGICGMLSMKPHLNHCTMHRKNQVTEMTAPLGSECELERHFFLRANQFAQVMVIAKRAITRAKQPSLLSK